MSEAGGERIGPTVCVSGRHGGVIDLARTAGTGAQGCCRHGAGLAAWSHEMVLLDLHMVE